MKQNKSDSYTVLPAKPFFRKTAAILYLFADRFSFVKFLMTKELEKKFAIRGIMDLLFCFCLQYIQNMISGFTGQQKQICPFFHVCGHKLLRSDTDSEYFLKNQQTAFFPPDFRYKDKFNDFRMFFIETSAGITMRHNSS